MQVRAWNNGAHHSSGAGYGLRVRIQDRDNVFTADWTHVVVTIPGQGPTTIPLTPSFWRTCSELRSAALGRWLLESGLAPWPRGAPPTIRLTHTGGNAFSIDDARAITRR